MSKDFVTADELAFLAKKRKELNVTDRLTETNRQQIETWISQSLQGWGVQVKKKDEPLLQQAELKEVQYGEGTALLDKIDAREVLAFQFAAHNKKGAHLVLLETFEIRPLVLDRENGELDLKSASVLGRIQETVVEDVQLFMEHYGEVSGLGVRTLFKQSQIWDKKSNLELFELTQFCQLNAVELTLLDNSMVRAWMISDLDFLDFVYNRLEIAEPLVNVTTAGQRVSETSTGSTKATGNSTVAIDSSSALSPVLNATASEVVKPVFQTFGETYPSTRMADIDLLNDIPLELSVVLGKTHKTVEEILSFNTGKVVELDKFADDPLEIYVNGKLVAEGEVVVVDENFGVKITRLYKNNINARIN